MTEKECRTCGISKPLSCYSPSKSGGKFGVQPYCKPCRAIRYRVSKSGEQFSESAWAVPQHQYSAADHAFRQWKAIEPGTLRAWL